MTPINSIAAEKLARLLGRPDTPVLIDVRAPEDFAANPGLIPGARRLNAEDVHEWGPTLKGRRVVVSCHFGRKRSEGAAAWLRHLGAQAESLEGGFEGWSKAGLPVLRSARLPERHAEGKTVWVTRARPKIDRIACPWLIRRFVDPEAVFLFVPTAEVLGVADRFGATPFDIDDEGVFWTHRGPLCTFDVMIEEFGLGTPPLQRLATIVRGADTARLDLAPEAAGLLAASLGLSRMYSDDLEQLEAGMLLYDAFYRWARDAVGETHNWPAKAAVEAQP